MAAESCVGEILESHYIQTVPKYKLCEPERILEKWGQTLLVLDSDHRLGTAAAGGTVRLFEQTSVGYYSILKGMEFPVGSDC
jgi:hypothetical protein